MTTAAQVKKMVQPLLARHTDLALVGRWIYVKPVHHFARAILIDRTAYAEEFEPQWAVIHLFQARKTFSLNWGEFLANERSRRRGLWFMSDPDVEASLIEALEQQALPKLRAIETLDDYLAFVARHMFGPKLFDWPQCRIIVDVALGKLDSARSICKENLPRWSVDRPNYDEDDKAENRRLRELCAKLAEDDRTGLARLLHEWEAYTVKNFKIEHLWEPTPFPLEMMG
ncbi:MAG: hypothetical protein WB500_06050 [Rhodoplanes sp.]